MTPNPSTPLSLRCNGTRLTVPPGICMARLYALALLGPCSLIAAIKSAPTEPQNTPAGAPPGLAIPGPTDPASPAIEDIAPPLDVLPYPFWILALCLLLILAFACLLLGIWMRRQPAPPHPPDPHAIARTALDALRSDIETLSPYSFSIAVSDIIRQFVEAKTGIHAVRQTSAEFLASISTRFPAAERSLLGEFLERCDLIKFARAEASSADSRSLLSTAESFILGRKS